MRPSVWRHAAPLAVALAALLWHGLWVGGGSGPRRVAGQAPANRLVVLFSDYGLGGADAAILRGEVKRAAPDVQVYDGSQALPAFDVAAASYVLEQTLPAWPAGTTFVVAVDPGVGDAKAMLAARVEPGGYLLVAPDNGVLTDVLGHATQVEVRTITNRAFQSSEDRYRERPGVTVLGPAAAVLARGGDLAEVGNPAPSVVGLPRVQPRVNGRWVAGSVVYVDSWGNLRTNIPEALLRQAGLRANADLTLLAGNGRWQVPWVKSYDEVAKGAPLVLRTLGSPNVEVAVAYGSAAERLGLQPGRRITLGPPQPAVLLPSEAPTAAPP